MKKFLTIISATVLASELVLPIASLAQTSSSVPVAGVNFCKNLQTTQFNATNIVNTITERKLKFRTNITALKTKHTDNFANGTTASDKVRTKVYGNLTAKATTDAEKQAVAVFQAAVEAAAKTRQEALKAANTTFHAGVDQIAAKEKSTADAAAATFKSSLDAAVSTASGQCAAGTSSISVALAFRASVAAATAKFKATLAPEDIRGQVKQLTDAYRESVKAATTAYRTAVQQAAQTLKSAFSKATSSPAATPTPPTE